MSYTSVFRVFVGMSLVVLLDLSVRVGNEVIEEIDEQHGRRNDGGGCATMHERLEKVESPRTYVTE